MSDMVRVVRCVQSLNTDTWGVAVHRGYPLPTPYPRGVYVLPPLRTRTRARVGARPSRTPQIPLDDTEQGHRDDVGGVWVVSSTGRVGGRERAAQEFSQVRAHEQSRNIRHMH